MIASSETARWIGKLSLIELQWLSNIVAEPGRMYRWTWCEDSLVEKELIDIIDGGCFATFAGEYLLETERDRWRTRHDRRNRDT